MATDRDPLPRRPLIDTGVLIRALGERPDDRYSPICAGLFQDLLAASAEILIAAPSISEILRFGRSQPVPRYRLVQVVSFDERAADWLGNHLPEAVLESVKTLTGLPRHYIKYDALIVACAARHKADCIISLDKGMKRVCEALNPPMLCQTPLDLGPKQQALALTGQS
jgi:predicted nucleic acid-binding protein